MSIHPQRKTTYHVLMARQPLITLLAGVFCAAYCHLTCQAFSAELSADDLIALPVRPAGKTFIPQASSVREEDSPTLTHETNKSLGAPAQAASAKNIVPTFYGDFVPAAKLPSNIPDENTKPTHLPPESPSLEQLRSENRTSLLAYDRTREIFRRLVPSAPTFNTDYRTRAANCEIPLTVRGRGLNGRDLPIGCEDAYRDQLPANFTPTDLVLVPAEYCYANQPIYLRREAAESVVRMIRDAERQGLTLRIVSGYRDYSHQNRLYRQNGGRRGSRTVGRPGKSEHMLGTTVDFTSTERYLLKPSFAGTAEGKWLARNAHRYGWKRTVVSGTRVIEPWHFRYFGSALGKEIPTKASSSPNFVKAVENVTKPVRAATGVVGKILGK
ncbi:MAG: M15 family metallopeptidase [Candidatus Sumerlaeaceae bacterium]|nr:M15 family metallopeptidase [Candidatus Sumerlaeaceae bacterium]